MNMRFTLGYPTDKCTVYSQNPIIIDGKYLICNVSYWGPQPCPFTYISCCNELCHGITNHGGADDYWIYDLEKSKSIRFNDILIHLIRDHNFFEGNVYHRLNPADVIDFFDIKPNINYKPQYTTEFTWVRLLEGGDISPCYNNGDNEKVDITKLANGDVEIEWITRKNILQSIYPNKTWCKVYVEGVPIKHSSIHKKKSIYQKKITKYVKLDEEKFYDLAKKYHDDIIFEVYD